MNSRRRWLILGGLLSATLGAAAWITDRADKADTDLVAEAQTAPERPPSPSPSAASSGLPQSTIEQTAPGRAQPLSTSAASSGPAQLHIEKLKSRSLGESTRDPFAMSTPPSGKRNRTDGAARTAPPRTAPPPAAPPPVAPPLPFTYMGQLTSGPEAKVFLTLGDRNLVLREGDIVDSIYRIEKIAGSAITLVYLPLDERQTIATGESP